MRKFRIFSSVALLIPALMTGAQVRAEDQDRAITSGLSLGIGAGHENAAIGAQALYYFQFPDDRWRVAPHVGVGYLGATGFAGGAMGSFGHRHRLVLDLVAGPMAATGGSEVATHLYYGVAALLGYEWMAASGLALRSTIGVAYRPTLAASERIYLAINVISINYKLW